MHIIQTTEMLNMYGKDEDRQMNVHNMHNFDKIVCEISSWRLEPGILHIASSVG